MDIQQQVSINPNETIKKDGWQYEAVGDTKARETCLIEKYHSNKTRLFCAFRGCKSNRWRDMVKDHKVHWNKCHPEGGPFTRRSIKTMSYFNAKKKAARIDQANSTQQHEISDHSSETESDYVDRYGAFAQSREDLDGDTATTTTLHDHDKGGAGLSLGSGRRSVLSDALAESNIDPRLESFSHTPDENVDRTHGTSMPNPVHETRTTKRHRTNNIGQSTAPFSDKSFHSNPAPAQPGSLPSFINPRSLDHSPFPPALTTQPTRTAVAAHPFPFPFPSSSSQHHQHQHHNPFPNIIHQIWTIVPPDFYTSSEDDPVGQLHDIARHLRRQDAEIERLRLELRLGIDLDRVLFF